MFLFLQESYASAVYVILPQLDGIIVDYLKKIGLIQRKDGYPVWTELAKSKGKCKNIKMALEEAKENNSFSIWEECKVVQRKIPRNHKKS